MSIHHLIIELITFMTNYNLLEKFFFLFVLLWSFTFLIIECLYLYTTVKNVLAMSSTVPKSSNIFWHDCPVVKSDRQKLVKQKGCVVWITGLSGSGN
jgi:hypothetical protein